MCAGRLRYVACQRIFCSGVTWCAVPDQHFAWCAVGCCCSSCHHRHGAASQSRTAAASGSIAFKTSCLAMCILLALSISRCLQQCVDVETGCVSCASAAVCAVLASPTLRRQRFALALALWQLSYCRVALHVPLLKCSSP